MSAYEAAWKTEELKILEDAVATFYQREMVPHIERWDEQGHVDREIWNKAGEAGILCASISEEFGGGGGHFGHEAVITEQQAKAGITSFGNSVHSTIVAHYLQSYGTEEQKKKWLPKFASGEMVGAIAMTEPGTGSDLQSVKTTALKEGNEYIINGQKTFITNGQQADLVIVVAKTDPGEGAKGISLVCVETAEAEGYTRGRNLDKIGLKGQDTSELFFDNVHVPMTNLLGTEEGQGFYQLMGQLPQERLSIGVSSVATVERAVELTREYVKERKAFGGPLTQFQNTRFVLAECMTEAKVARVFLDFCISELIEGRLDTVTASMSKWWHTDLENKIIDKCLQLYGGYGYMNEYPIARMYRDSRVQKIYGGTNEIMKEIIGRTI